MFGRPIRIRIVATVVKQLTKKSTNSKSCAQAVNLMRGDIMEDYLRRIRAALTPDTSVLGHTPKRRAPMR